ncbi:MAG: hypothetical protein ABIO85_09710 [Sphingomicrobium sp.]
MVIGETALTLAMIAAFLLGGAGLRWAFRSEPITRQRGLLMVGAALVILANVLIWTL